MLPITKCRATHNEVRPTWWLASLLVAMVASGPSHADAGSPRTIAVMSPIGDGVSADQLRVFSTRLRGELRVAGCRVPARSRVETALVELGAEHGECVDVDCVSELGKRLGVEGVVIVDLVAYDGMYGVTAQLIDVEAGRVERVVRDVYRGALARVLISAPADLAARLTGEVSAADAVTPPTVAVMDPIGDGVSANQLRVLSTRLRGELRVAGYVVPARRLLEEELSELGAERGECADVDCISELGKRLGAEGLVTVAVVVYDGAYGVNTRLIDVETGRVERVVRDVYPGAFAQVLSSAPADLAARLTGEVSLAQDPQLRTTEKPRLAVLRIPGDNVPRHDADLIAVSLRTALSESGRYRVMGRGEADSLAAEHEQPSADKLVTGEVTLWDSPRAGRVRPLDTSGSEILESMKVESGARYVPHNTYVIRVRLVDVASGEKEREVQVSCPCTLDFLLSDGVRRIVEELSEVAPRTVTTRMPVPSSRTVVDTAALGRPRWTYPRVASELVAGLVASYLCWRTGVDMWRWNLRDEGKSVAMILVAQPVAAGTAVYLVGGIGEETGSYWAAIRGAFYGVLFPIFGPPVYGAIAYNKTRAYEGQTAPENVLLHIDRDRVELGIPAPTYRSSLAGDEVLRMLNVVRVSF